MILAQNRVIHICSSSPRTLSVCNDQYDYHYMRLAEVFLFLLFKSVARGAFPPFFDIIARKVPYRVLNYL